MKIRFAALLAATLSAAAQAQDYPAKPVHLVVPYDPVRDFAPVAQCVVYQYVLVTLAGSLVKSIADLVEAARAKPGAVSYGSTGVGGGNHLAGELLALATHTQLT